MGMEKKRKRKMKKQVLAVVLSVLLALSTGACGSREAGEDKRSTGMESQGSGAEGSGTEPAGEIETAEGEEPVTITMEIFDRGNLGAWVDADAGESVIDNRYVNLMREAVREELNIDLQYVAIPRSEEITKIQTLMAAKNEPDIFFTYSSDQFLKWAGDGALADLGTYVTDTEEGRKLQEFLGDAVINSGKVHGKQVAINGANYNYAQLASFIRKDLLDKVGVELRELNGHYALTASELEDALLKIKKAGFCEYPYALLNMWQCLEPITGAFVDDASFDSQEELIQNAEDTFFTLPGTKEAYRFLNKCYNEGLINPDFPLYKEENLTEMVASGEAAFWSYAAWKYLGKDGALDSFYAIEPQAEVVSLEIIQEDGTPARYYKGSPMASYGMVSANCQNVEAAFRLIAWMNTSEKAHLLTAHGIEGENYVADQDGDLIFLEDSEYVGNADMNMWQNNCSCKKSDEDILRLYVKNNTGVVSDKNIETYQQSYKVSTSEGKVSRLIPQSIIVSANEWALSLSENADNLIIGSITATVEKFDDVYDRYYEVYMEEGGAQIAEERLASLK